MRNICYSILILLITAGSCSEKEDRDMRPNIIFVLADDHRYDAMGFMGHPFLETPNMDKMANKGIYFSNAFVTTSLCSPSRASILSGLYAHTHGVVDNYHPIKEGITFFPFYLQQSGYETAFIGKWHMGGDDDSPREGFDYWLSFKGQGTYWADGHGTNRKVPQNNMDGYNLNGSRVPQKGYITDELTDYALDWMNDRKTDKPFMAYISHKAAHTDFVAADRHIGKYGSDSIPSFPNHGSQKKPMWLINQRNSRHGADFGYNLPNFDLNYYYQRYCETILSVDENLGRILRWADNQKSDRPTMVVYMGDNGFHFGDKGIIDKRTAYESSIRVPLLMYSTKSKKSRKVVEMVANIDMAPTFLELAGISVPNEMQGRSMVPLIQDDEQVEWRKELLYEYYWERNYPFTPTTHAIYTREYKFIRYHGIWDMDEFYDLRNDPDETENLIFSRQHQGIIEEYRERLFEVLASSDGGRTMPFLEDRGNYYPLRHPEKSEPANFPEEYLFEVGLPD